MTDNEDYIQCMAIFGTVHDSKWMWLSCGGADSISRLRYFEAWCYHGDANATQPTKRICFKLAPGFSKQHV